MRYKVLDETGAALRLFQSKQEALRFLQEGWTVAVMPRRNPYLEALKSVGEARL